MSMFFKRLLYKIKKLDKFYLDLETENIALYQKHFLTMVNSVDLNNLTEHSMNRNYNKGKAISDYKKLDKILDEAEKDGLIIQYLQVMFEQYVYADTWQREKYVNLWVKRVMKRKSVDIFPSPQAVLHNLY